MRDPLPLLVLPNLGVPGTALRAAARRRSGAPPLPAVGRAGYSMPASTTAQCPAAADSEGSAVLCRWARRAVRRGGGRAVMRWGRCRRTQHRPAVPAPSRRSRTATGIRWAVRAMVAALMLALGPWVPAEANPALKAIGMADDPVSRHGGRTPSRLARRRCAPSPCGRRWCAGWCVPAPRTARPDARSGPAPPASR